MFRDPLYRQIRRRLRELKDGNTFEQCANDLLSKIYPSLAPREGGDDAGLDGLIATEGKSSIQLICTTGEDVLGNLSGSIESNLKKGGKKAAPRKTKKNVVASSVMDTVEMSADERKELGLDPLPVEPEDSQEEQEEPHPEIEIFEKKPWALPITKYPQEDIVFVTPYTEITVAAYEVYIDATCFTMVTPRNDRVKMKPKKGATFEAVYKDTMYNLYASGIYIPITSIASILSIFFVIPDNQGAEE